MILFRIMEICRFQTLLIINYLEPIRNLSNSHDRSIDRFDFSLLLIFLREREIDRK